MLFPFLLKIIIEHFVSNSSESDQKPHFAASDLGLHCLNIWVKSGLRKGSKTLV